MPDAKDNAKLTGDTHPPELEETDTGITEDMPQGVGADGTPRDRGPNGGDAGRPGRDENAAGFVKDKDLASGGRDKGGQ